tara:strand:+ start:198 stop:518 length:321 start_codon:yes stop_codon:yes gene_type:complete
MNTINYKVNDNGNIRDMTDAEKALIDSSQKPVDLNALKLSDIREIRNQKLSETDYLATSDNTMSDEMKAFRKSMRDIPQDYDSSKYDELLARDSDGKLTHTVWEKP